MAKKKPIPKSKNRVKQDLSAIENKLFEYARKGKSVFLYGQNSIDRKAMIGNIGKQVLGKHKFISRRKKDGDEVFVELTNSHEGILLKCSGSLFVNNLYCDPKNNKDYESYSKLAKFIRDGGITVKWLVVYAFNRKNFPDIFKRQFKMISLKNEIEKTVAKGCDKEKKKKRRQRISDNVFKQLCREVERECSRALNLKMFFNELSKMSKTAKYDKTRRGYTPLHARKRYYEVFPSKKANH
jgi:hypothetical protein